MTQPPRIATWMLKHFGSGPDNDTLLGDLAEQYQRNGSAMWYWRQALKAIPVSLFKEIRGHKWIAARALLTGWVVWMICEIMIPPLGRGFYYFSRVSCPLSSYYCDTPPHWRTIRLGNWPVSSQPADRCRTVLCRFVYFHGPVAFPAILHLFLSVRGHGCLRWACQPRDPVRDSCLCFTARYSARRRIALRQIQDSGGLGPSGQRQTAAG